MEEILLQAEHLSYSYGDGNKALYDVSLSVRKGEKIAVLGSNGAGKSTCFFNLNGVLIPDSGTIWYQGKKIEKKELSELRRKVGVVFQDADNQIIASTVSAEVSFGPMNLKLPREQVKTRVDMALESMNLMMLRDRPPHYLSGGEKKRVSIADILAMEPEVILFDEPTASLDPVNVDMLTKVLGKMSDMGKTLLISTHDVDFAYQWADRAVVFAGGTIIADGPVTDILACGPVLKQGNLRKPVLMEVYDSLVKRRIILKNSPHFKNTQELDHLLKAWCED
ncbi:ABC transporter ATP-binding protein [Clostridium boliviensis]|uniref:ABC transporter ATP-binding protein n=1 Tax=Clostridium boliviensis TaxID=318465 RepID=A0ABU4GRV6_9CLOT|nr:ABC transporter ATP-binding protein [Clostridium boliviensis]MDW2800366.1 ABC transporter ATP-binding protein [Clostridium boliviensis]